MVNFLSFYLKDLQTVLAPIYEQTRKRKNFSWGKEQQKAFEKIKKMLVKPPVLVMPNGKDLFMLYSDTSKIACGSALYQKTEWSTKASSILLKEVTRTSQKV